MRNRIEHKYPKYFEVMPLVGLGLFIPLEKHVISDTIMHSPKVLLLLTAIFISQLPRLGFKGNTTVPLDFYSWLSSFFAPFFSHPFSLTHLNRSRK